MAKDFYTVSGSTVVPPLATGITATGTVLNDSKIIIGTDLKQLQEGDWILDSTNLIRRRVETVVSDTKIVINEPFPVSFSPFSFNVVRGNDSAIVFMEITAIGDITVDGVSVLDGTAVSFGNKNDSATSSKFTKPRLVGGDARINLEFFNNTFAD